MEFECAVRSLPNYTRTIAQFDRQTRWRIRVSSDCGGEIYGKKNSRDDAINMAHEYFHAPRLVPPKQHVKPGYFKLTGFSGFKSFGTNSPFLRTSSPSNHISPPP